MPAKRSRPSARRSTSLPAVTRDGIVPLYRQIHELIRHRISSGAYPQGGQIPSENELCRELQVSRVTLREALRKLVQDRLLVKVPGKGTFAALEQAKGLSPVKYAGFLEDLQERVLNLNVVEVDTTRIAPSDELRTLLQLGPSDRELVVFKRLRHIDGEPFAYTLNYLRPAVGDRVPVEKLHTVPLLTILREHLGIPIVRARETIEAAPADPEVARKLGIPVLFPVMHMKRVMFTIKDRPLELVETFYRADKYHYSVNLVRVRRGDTWRWRTEVETSA
jgi:GntR family transcriptional regulator